jgi:hypothetical protein
VSHRGALCLDIRAERDEYSPDFTRRSRHGARLQGKEIATIEVEAGADDVVLR